MKNTPIKMAWNRAFTLIELMIVIVILGILMATILPRVTGGQARARDTGRIADLSNIEQALNLYNVDYGEFPDPTSAGHCMTSTAYPKVASYMKGNKIPTPAATEVVGSCTGAYYYDAFKWRGEDYGAYLLGASMDTFQLANTRISYFSGKSPDSVGELTPGPSGTGDAKLQSWFGLILQDITALGTRFNTNPEDMGYVITGTQ